MHLPSFRFLRYALIAPTVSLIFLAICFSVPAPAELANPHSVLGGTVLLAMLDVNAAALLALVIFVPVCVQALLHHPERRTSANITWVVIGSGVLIGIGAWLAEVTKTLLSRSPYQ